MLNLAEYGRIRIMADRLGVDTIDRDGSLVVLKFRPQARVDPARLVRVVGEWPGAVLVPPVSLKLDLEAKTAGVGAGGAPPSRGRTPDAADAGRRQGSGPSRHGSARGHESRSSWWTARATAGEVTPGFTKDDILRQPEGDPRASGGMFSRLEGLLRALGG
jgi:hypothetical protein